MSVVHSLAFLMFRLRVRGVAKTLLQRGQALFGVCFVPQVFSCLSKSVRRFDLYGQLGQLFLVCRNKNNTVVSTRISCLYRPKVQTSKRFYNRPDQIKMFFPTRKMGGGNRLDFEAINRGFKSRSCRSYVISKH